MRITVLSEERIRLENGAPVTIDPESVDISYSPFHMLASGIGSCMFSVLQSWATNAKIPTDHLAMEIGWRSAKNANRTGSFDVRLMWPSLPESRRDAAARAVKACAVHSALVPPPVINIGTEPMDESSAPGEGV
ncbi:MAG: OsmC family protein [Anaerolineae bacterium]|nr:OsmC family protein [Gemmatimonadaceae bacterium]